MNIDQATQAKCQAMIMNGVDTEAVIRFLRYSGATKGESILLLNRFGRGTFDEMKSAVHRSKTWGDTRETDDKFQEELGDAADS